MKSNEIINNQRIQVFKFKFYQTDKEMTHTINKWIENLDIEIKILNITSNTSYDDVTILFLTYEIINNGK